MYGHNDGMTDMEREMRIAVNEAELNCYCKNENMGDCRKCFWRNICIRHNPFECGHFKKEYGD